jgi:hypothetical protein
MKSILVGLFFFLFFFSYGQQQHRININATTFAGFPSVGYERSLAPHFSFHIDAISTLSRSYQEKPLKIFMLTPEIRWYANANNTGFYASGHLAGTVFQLQKYTYKNTDLYQKGLAYQLGVSLGYVYPVSNRVSLEAFVGGGSLQSFYKGYDASTGIRYDLAKDYNKSGEVLLYRGGFKVIYSL